MADKTPSCFQLRIVSRIDPSLSQTIEFTTEDLEDLLASAKVSMRPIEIARLEEYGGVENDEWLVRIRCEGDPLEDGAVHPARMLA